MRDTSIYMKHFRNACVSIAILKYYTRKFFLLKKKATNKTKAKGK